MPRYASKYPEYAFPAVSRRAKKGFNERGEIAEVVEDEGYTARFKDAVWLDKNEEREALDFFFPLQDGFMRSSSADALPSQSAGILTGTKNTMFFASNPIHRISMFDTADVPEQYRDEVEAKLASNQAYGVDYIELVSSSREPAEPWDGYAKLKGAGVDARVRKAVEDAGIDPELVVAYETWLGDKGRPSVVKAMRELQSKRSAALEAAKALTVEL